MKEKVNVTDYANLITKALPKGILLNTNAEKFNSMVIGWGHLGTLWGKPTFHVYVRQGKGFSHFAEQYFKKCSLFNRISG